MVKEDIFLGYYGFTASISYETTSAFTYVMSRRSNVEKLRINNEQALVRRNNEQELSPKQDCLYRHRPHTPCSRRPTYHAVVGPHTMQSLAWDIMQSNVRSCGAQVRVLIGSNRPFYPGLSPRGLGSNSTLRTTRANRSRCAEVVAAMYLGFDSIAWTSSAAVSLGQPTCGTNHP